MVPCMAIFVSQNRESIEPQQVASTQVKQKIKEPPEQNGKT